MGLGYPLSPKSRTSDILDSFWLWVETLGTVVQPNANRRQSRKIGRRILLFIFLLNMFIFTSNVFWLRRDLMKEEDESLTKLSFDRFWFERHELLKRVFLLRLLIFGGVRFLEERSERKVRRHASLLLFLFVCILPPTRKIRSFVCAHFYSNVRQKSG